MIEFKMSDVCRDIGTIWSRLFDHRSFLCGEINCMLEEFEQKRGDTEVDYLFKAIENITDIKDTEIDRLKQAVVQITPDTRNELQQALRVCEGFGELENRYNQRERLINSKLQRKNDWENFMDYITSSYSEINSLTETKEKNLETVYSNLEKKLQI